MLINSVIVCSSAALRYSSNGEDIRNNRTQMDDLSIEIKDTGSLHVL